MCVVTLLCRRVAIPPPSPLNTINIIGIYAFVIEKDGVTDSEEEVIQHLKQLIRKQIGGFAVPECFLVRIYIKSNIQCTIM